MNAHSKTLAPSAGAIRIPLSKIHYRRDLCVRYGPNVCSHHVRELRQAVKRGAKLPQLLVWQEVDAAGTPSGRFVLLDGRHRLAALREEKRGLQDVLAEVLRGTRQEALAAAASRNAKVSLPLTRLERVNAAWAIVRAEPSNGGGMSKRGIAQACGVGDGTVGRMRRRWAAWPSDVEPSGSWLRDQREEGEEDAAGCGEPMEAEAQRLAKEIRKVVGKIPELNIDLFAEAIDKLLGWRTGYVVDYLRGSPEDEVQPYSGLEGDHDPNVKAEVGPDDPF